MGEHKIRSGVGGVVGSRTGLVLAEDWGVDHGNIKVKIVMSVYKF